VINELQVIHVAVTKFWSGFAFTVSNARNLVS